jgi:ligand-binding sensor domain-containing protein
MSFVRNFFALFLVLGWSCVIAQENIPLGNWRVHVSYNRVRTISLSQNQVFAASSNGLVVLDKSDKSTTTYDKLNLLTRSGINKLNYHAASGQLLIAYDDGTFDAVYGNEARNFDPSRNTVLTGPREIHNIMFHDGIAYLATDYGVLLFDLARQEIKETWRDLAPDGNTLKIFGSAFHNDSIFLATERGVLAGNPADNLLDFTKWKRMNQGELDASVVFVTVFNNLLYVVVEGNGIFAYDGSSWQKQPYLDGVEVSSFTSSPDHLVIAESQTVWKIDRDALITSVSGGPITAPLDAREDESGHLWIGDEANGLLTDQSGNFETIVPNGPASDASFRLSYSGNKMYAVAGGFTGDASSMNPGFVSSFENGIWSSSTEPVKDVTDISFSGDNKMFLSSFGYGVLDKTSNVLYDENNSSLINVSPPARNVKVSALHHSTHGLWVANYGTISSLHLLNTQNDWTSFVIPFASASYPVDLLTDFEGKVWMLLSPQHGGGMAVFDPGSNESTLLTEVDESGELPSNGVYSMALDRDGYVWAGTDAGVAYFYDEGSDAIKPIFENQFLLRDEKVTAIAVDGGNRKWMGTERGVWLFNPAGDAAIANFTKANSPLLSDKIVDIEVHPVSGEVFFSTDKGLVSFRSDATESTNAFREVKIFPNPVLANFSGEVGISGLATDAVVKITDVSGKLIFETMANGGTASWNVRDHYGRRVPTGVFLVFAVTADGSESIVGKIAVVN